MSWFSGIAGIGADSIKDHLIGEGKAPVGFLPDQDEAIFREEFTDLIGKNDKIMNRSQVGKAEYDTEITDLDGDKKITTKDFHLAQAKAQKAALAKFDKIDANGDGKISISEIETANTAALNGTRYLEQFNAVQPNLIDTDKNGTVSQSEADAIYADGVISRSEVADVYADTFNFIDTNKDGVIDGRERFEETQRGSFSTTA